MRMCAGQKSAKLPFNNIYVFTQFPIWNCYFKRFFLLQVWTISFSFGFFFEKFFVYFLPHKYTIVWHWWYLTYVINNKTPMCQTSQISSESATKMAFSLWITFYYCFVRIQVELGPSLGSIELFGPFWWNIKPFILLNCNDSLQI